MTPSRSAPYKSELFLKLGELCLAGNSPRAAETFFKKALQYAWYFGCKQDELLAYDCLGRTSMYLLESSKAAYYHMRYTSADYEADNTHARIISKETVVEYLAGVIGGGGEGLTLIVHLVASVSLTSV